jgi:hypothetical protein
MNVKKLFACILFVVSLPVAAEFETVSRAYEIAMSDFRVPATPSSGVQFKECAECDYTIIRVTPNTQYRVNQQSVELKEFRKRVFGIKDRAATMVIVLHHLESDTVEAVSVSY